MSTARYHHGNLRQALLVRGLRTAAQHGPMSLQVRDLAAAEGVSASAVYRHFPDLAHLSADVARLAREQLAQAMLDAAATVGGRADDGLLAVRRFDAIGRAYIEFALRDPHLFDMAFQAPAAPASCADEPSAWGVLSDALDALVVAGELQPSMRADAPMVAWSAVHGLASVIVRRMLPATSGECEAITAVLGGVRRALALRSEL
ncbi:MAG TPA: TetR/AcrR family transcriptional regulator [Gemmatimonadaceae bacterium]|nr:TetR/AcrR family transcriptional regulator [Gemmatimonadaceae bacterium]